MPMACVQRYRFRTWASLRPVQRPGYCTLACVCPLHPITTRGSGHQWHIFRLPGCGFTGSKLWFLAGIHYVHRPAGGLGSGHQLLQHRICSNDQAVDAQRFHERKTQDLSPHIFSHQD